MSPACLRQLMKISQMANVCKQVHLHGKALSHQEHPQTTSLPSVNELLKLWNNMLGPSGRSSQSLALPGLLD